MALRTHVDRVHFRVVLNLLRGPVLQHAAVVHHRDALGHPERDIEIVLGNLDSKRDWGFAGDYVTAMWKMLQADTPDDYVIATGETHSIEELVERAFGEVGIDDWRPYVRQDPKFFRPAEVDILLGDPSKARATLGWSAKTSFDELVREMVAFDLDEAKRDRLVASTGFKTYQHHE